MVPRAEWWTTTAWEPAVRSKLRWASQLGPTERAMARRRVTLLTQNGGARPPAAENTNIDFRAAAATVAAAEAAQSLQTTKTQSVAE
uniref:Uncharacterized protein n=1 Tax=Plectus sambesii TaxID=2011161 RepID=A0A914WLC1_9BILA